MKKTAAILLFLFTLVQVGLAVSTLFTETCTVFVTIDDKSEEKTETEKKDKKDYTAFACNSDFLSHKISTAFHLAEKIQAYPCLEKFTPPPNFC